MGYVLSVPPSALQGVGLGIVFQYLAIAPMKGRGAKDGPAPKADPISLTRFEIGLFGWMTPMAFVFSPAPHHLMPNAAAFWFLLQVVTAIGFYVLAANA